MSLPCLMLATAVGMNVHIPPPDTLDLTTELGAGWVRIDFAWDVAEPANGVYDWAPFDAVVDGAKARGLQVYASIGGTPAWASLGDQEGDGALNDIPDPGAYQQFVTEAAARYSDGRVAAWGVWNEPNLTGFFEGTIAQWIEYVFAPGVDGIKAGCPSCLVLGPELASIGSDYQEHLEAALDSRGSSLDAVSWHVYAPFPEDDAGAGITSDSYYNKLDAHRIVQVGPVVVYEGQLSVREVLDAKGFGNLPVWVTETGEEATLGDASNEETQRVYTQRVLDAMETRPWWERTFFYELVEEHPNGMFLDSEWGLALRTSAPDATYADDFTRKAAFDAMNQRLCGVGGSGAGGSSATGGASGSSEGAGARGGAGAGPGSGGAGADGGGARGSSGGTPIATGGGALSETPDGGSSGGCVCAMPAAPARDAGAGWIGVVVAAALGARLARRRREALTDSGCSRPTSR